MAQKQIKHVYGNVLRIAIPLQQTIRTLVDGEEHEETSDFYPNPNFPTNVVLRGSGTIRYEYTATVVGNVATIEDKGDIRIGTYQVEVLCHDENGEPVRYMVRQIIKIVDATIDASIETGIEFNVETYTLNGTVFFYAKGDKGDQGVSVESVEQIQTSTESEGVNIVRVTLSNGTTSDFEVRNGKAITPTFDVENKTLIFNK